MLRFAAIALVACTLAPGAPAAEVVVLPPAPLDTAALAKQSKTIEIADDDLRTALAIKGDGAGLSPALDLGGGSAAVAWSECTQAACHGTVALVSGAPAAPKQTRRAPLVGAAKLFAVDGLQFTDVALADLDGDGTPELVLRYAAVETPRAALGSVTHDYVAVYAAKDLTLLFSRDLRRAGAATEDACTATVMRRGGALQVDTACNVRRCLEAPDATCKPNRTTAETWRRAPGKPYAKAR